MKTAITEKYLFARQKAGEKISDFLHPNAHKSAFELHRHQSFIYSHLLGAAVALALYPVYLYRVGMPGLSGLLVFAWFLSPLATAYYLCRSGNLGRAHLISSLNLAVFVTVGAYLTGGINSFLVGWMIIVPLEAALSGKRSIIIGAVGIAAGALAGLFIIGQHGWLPAEPSLLLNGETLALFGIFTATLYGGAIAMTVQQGHEDSEAAIRQSQMKYQLMADNASDMIAVHNSNGEAVFVSPAARVIAGAGPYKLLGNGLMRRIHISDRPIYMTAISNCLHNNDPVNVEFRLERGAENDGLELSPPRASTFEWVEMRCQAVDDALAPGERHIVSITRDISSHKNQEITLLKARDSAESANLAKTRFLANMSHELRTPLNAIIGFSDVLNMELYGRIENKKYSDYARLINEAGEHLLSVVNNILDMSKIEVGKFSITPEPFALEPLITGCCDMIEPVANEQAVSVVGTFDSDVDEIYADSRALKQMMLNLLSNAIKFSHKGDEVLVRTTSNSCSVYIDVIDHGIGISPEDLPKLCNPFVQADSSYKREHEGVGLGLSVVKGLAELHGGALKIESQLGKGTHVRIELPVTATLDVESGHTIFDSQNAGNSVVLFQQKNGGMPAPKKAQTAN